ncbi:MAG: NAD(P)-binding domain-containing protein [Bacteroidota bacterium]
MRSLFAQYTRWLHTRWPAGIVEKLPEAKEDGSTTIQGLYVVGDLTGIPLLKFSADSGARAVRRIASDPAFQRLQSEDRDGRELDIVIIGAGVSGMAAALEARKEGMRFELLEATEPFSTIVNFPRGKPIYAYPTEMVPEGDLQFTATVKEPLVEELRAQTLERGIRPRIVRVERVVREAQGFTIIVPGDEAIRARRVIVAIGRSGNFRKLGVRGEEREKVYNRLHDPQEFEGKNVLVVGGGDSALETAIAVAQCGGNVTLSYRRAEFSRPKPENVARLDALLRDPLADVAVETPVSERVTTSSGAFLGDHWKAGTITLLLKSQLKNIGASDVTLVDGDGRDLTIPNDAVFSMTGRDAPLDFFRRSGVRIRGEMGWKGWTGLSMFVAFCAFVYTWKAGGSLTNLFRENLWFPFNVQGLLESVGGSFTSMVHDPSTLLGTIAVDLGEPGFYYSVVYSLLILVFGFKRIRRRRTPYVTAQTLTLTAIQVIPLFLLPYILLPYLGYNGAFDAGFGKNLADALFPEVSYGHGREYWRAFGFILAWPLFLWNVFTSEPLWWWLLISLAQTFLLIPLIVRLWGKGAYCGWICSCGAMAETLGDTHRHKMPHGSGWNRANMIGQLILAIAVLLLIARVVSWVMPSAGLGEGVRQFYAGLLSGWELFGVQLNYKYVVDLFLAGIIGYGAYFWFSGRVWCRFACPLAALMHIYARFSRFRILVEKKKCISCNVCTSVCHQGIDVMNFANKGLPMEDPECVRCSACVQSCPTGVLQFGRIDPRMNTVVKIDNLAASPVMMREHNS